MSILGIVTTPPTGLVGILPQIIYVNTSDTVALVSAAGYLNSSVSQGFQYANNQMALVYTTDSGPQWFQVSVAAATGIITLIPDINPGNVLLPVVVGRIPTFTNLAGQIGDVAVTATHQGSIQAGSATAQGSFIAFGVANAGVNDKLTVSYLTSGANRGLTLTNVAMGQATIVTMPDPGVAAAQYILNNNAGTQTIATGNLALTLGNITATAGNISATAGSLSAGTTVTAGTNVVATAGNVVAGNSAGPAAGNLQSFPAASGGANDKLVLAATTSGGNFTTTITNRAMGQASTMSFADPGNAAGSFLVAATITPFTANHSLVANGTGGLIADAGYQQKVVAQAAVAGGAAAQTVMDAFCTVGSMVTGSWNDTTNAVSIQKIAAGVGQFIVTSSGDPGASHLNYIITKV